MFKINFSEHKKTGGHKKYLVVTAPINLQKFTSSYGSRSFATCEFFPLTSVFFSRCGCFGFIMKNHIKSVFFKVINSSATSTKFISNINVFNNIKMTLYYSVCMHTSGEKIHISDEAERVQSISYSHIRSLSGLYTVMCLREGN